MKKLTVKNCDFFKCIGLVFYEKSCIQVSTFYTHFNSIKKGKIGGNASEEHLVLFWAVFQ